MAEPEAASRIVRDWSFLYKLIAALALAGIAQGLFVNERAGATVGGFALLLLVIVALVRPLLWRHRGARLALAAAAFFALVLTLDPGPLALLLYWTMLTLAMLLPRGAQFGDGWRWTHRLALHGVLSPFAPLRDLAILNRARSRSDGSFGRIALMLVLPVLGTMLFLALFAAANPLIENFLLRLDVALSDETIGRGIFAGLIFLAVWSLVRPPRMTFTFAGVSAPLRTGGPLPGVTPASVTLSLIAFNLIFAVQNGLDITFLWSGAPLPGDLTLAGYAHRGAYPLIATALLAALFVLVTMRPGADTARSTGVKLLVTLWIAQNLLLVASTIYRTVDYIESYSLTVLRISALIWMGLVAIGLVLVCYRLLRGRSGAWLINANMLAALLVLGACTCVDLGRIAASWNVRHAREVGGRGVQLDLCYLRQLDSSALMPLAELESRNDIAPQFRERVRGLRTYLQQKLRVEQDDWHGWTLRGAARLAEADGIVGERRLPATGGVGLDCSPLPAMVPPPPELDLNAALAPGTNAIESGANVIVRNDDNVASPLTGNEAR